MTQSSYYRARYYDPTVGKFLSEDPLGFVGRSSNFYEYVYNNPFVFTDPAGLSAETCRRKECHNVYQQAVYGQFVANNILPQLSLFSYIPPVGGYPGNGHTGEAYGELPFLYLKIRATTALAAAATENAATGAWLTALSDLGTPLSGTILAQGEAALSRAALQEAGVAAAEFVAPVAAAAIVTATIQDALVWFHCW
jgi:uncharacterized protein RhaS with RHS repeats